jgi:hypothetical protein
MNDDCKMASLRQNSKLFVVIYPDSISCSNMESAQFSAQMFVIVDFGIFLKMSQ